MTRTCKTCSKPITGHGGALYCIACGRERTGVRVDTLGRKRAGVFTRLKIDGKYCCIDCKEPIAVPLYSKLPSLRCQPCWWTHLHFKDILSGRQEAAKQVAKARRTGALKPPAEFDCVDCGREAECYDHRDYAKPLDVEPVCRSCNVIRGPAKPVPQPA